LDDHGQRKPVESIQTVQKKAVRIVSGQKETD
jgi:hypothetical protein